MHLSRRIFHISDIKKKNYLLGFFWEAMTSNENRNLFVIKKPLLLEAWWFSFGFDIFGKSPTWLFNFDGFLFQAKGFSRYKNKRALVSSIRSQYFRILTFCGLVDPVEGIRPKTMFFLLCLLTIMIVPGAILTKNASPVFSPALPTFRFVGRDQVAKW